MRSPRLRCQQIVLGESLLSGPQTVVFLLGPPMAEGGEGALSAGGVSSIGALIPW